jgi:hypothetical protein
MIIPNILGPRWVVILRFCMVWRRINTFLYEIILGAVDLIL